jgi:hypothetical protein
MRAHEHLPYQIKKMENSDEKNKSAWKLSYSTNCLKTYELDIKMENKGMYKLLLK